MSKRSTVKAKALSIFVAAALVISTIPSFAFADEEEVLSPDLQEGIALEEGAEEGEAFIPEEEAPAIKEEDAVEEEEVLLPIEDEEEVVVPDEDEATDQQEASEEEAVADEENEMYAAPVLEGKISSPLDEGEIGVLSDDMQTMAAGPTLIWIGSTYIYSGGSARPMPKGVSYNSSTGTLTLSNYSGTTEIGFSGGTLTLNLAGTNKAKAIGSTSGNLVIKGSGSLTCDRIETTAQKGSFTMSSAKLYTGAIIVGYSGKVFTLNSGTLSIDSSRDSYLASSDEFIGIATRSNRATGNDRPIMNFLGGSVSIVDKRNAKEADGIGTRYGDINIKNCNIRMDLKAKICYGLACGYTDSTYNPKVTYGGKLSIQTSRVAIKTSRTSGLSTYSFAPGVTGKAYYYAGNNSLADSSFAKIFVKKKYSNTVSRSETSQNTVLISQNAFNPVKRLGGSNRYITMESILKAGFANKRGGTVIIATGENYPDALAASGLAGLSNAPVILTSKAALTAEAKSEISRLGAKKAYIIGSTAAVSSAVEKSVNSMGVKVTRLAGANRIDTAIKIFNEGSKIGTGWSKTAIIASGTGFADALSISSYSYAKKAPIFLTGGDKKLSKESLSAIKAGKFTNIIIVGGTPAVSGDVPGQLTKNGIKSGNIARWAGKDRYETCLVIAKKCVAAGMKLDKMAIATGSNFPDALSGAALCGKNNAVIMLVADNPGAKAHVNSLISTNRASIKTVYALGSTTVVPTSVTNYVRGCLL